MRGRRRRPERRRHVRRRRARRHLRRVLRRSGGSRSAVAAVVAPSGPPRGQDMEVAVAIDVRTGGVRRPDPGRGEAAAGLRRLRRLRRRRGHEAGHVRRLRRQRAGPPRASERARPDGVDQPVPAVRWPRRDDHHAVRDVPRRGPGHGRQDVHGRRAGRRRRRITLRLTRRGAAGPRGGAPGDLYVHLRVRPHDRYRARGRRSRHRGADLDRPGRARARSSTLATLDGDEELAVPAGTQPGPRVRRCGAGACPVCTGAVAAISGRSSASRYPTKLSSRRVRSAAHIRGGSRRGGRRGRHQPLLEDQVGVLVTPAADGADVRRRAAAHVLVADVVQRRSSTTRRRTTSSGCCGVRDGEAVTVTDGAGRMACRAGAAGGALVADRRRSTPSSRVATIRSRSACAIPKQDRPEWIVQKLTELGVDRIVLLHAERSVVRWDGRSGGAAPRQAAPGRRGGAAAVAWCVVAARSTGRSAALDILPQAVGGRSRRSRPIAGDRRPSRSAPREGGRPTSSNAAAATVSTRRHRACGSRRRRSLPLFVS